MLKESNTKYHVEYRRKWGSLIQRRYSASLIVNVLIFCLGILISGACCFGSCVISGVAFVGALGSVMRAFSGLLGVVTGYLLFYDFSSTLLYISAAIFVYTIAFLFQYTRLYQFKWFMPSIVFLVMLMNRAYGTIDYVRGSDAQILEHGLEIFVGAGLTYLYSLVLRWREFNTSKSQNLYSFISILATIFTVFPNIEILSKFSLISVLTVFVLLSVIHKGTVQAYPVAVMLGFAMQFGCVQRVGALSLFLMYSVADVMLLRKNRFLLSVYFLLITFAHELYYCGTVLIFERMGEVVFALLIFGCVPKQISRGEADRVCDPLEQSRRNAMNIRNLSYLIKDSSEKFSQNDLIKRNMPDAHYILDRAFEEVCVSCEKQSICWGKGCVDSLSLLEKVTKCIEERGKVELNDFNYNFRTHCINCQNVVTAINYELRRWSLKERLSEIEQNAAILSRRQYSLFGEMLDEIAYQMINHKWEENSYTQNYSVEIGFASKRKTNEGVCGDSVKYFKTTDGLLYVVLSDGIGSGDEAEKYSSFVVSVMENGLKLLCDPHTLIELAHLTLCSFAPWGAATLDVLSINLKSGELIFYKLGASESFLCISNEMTIIEGNIYSLGSQNDIACVKPSRYQLSSDAIIILASDGASLKMKTEFMQHVLKNQNNMKHAARQLLLHTGSEVSDDKTIIAISVKGNS